VLLPARAFDEPDRIDFALLVEHLLGHARDAAEQGVEGGAGHGFSPSATRTNASWRIALAAAFFSVAFSPDAAKSF